MALRYQQIEFIFDYIKPQSVVEIGTWNGDRAISMARRALLHQKKFRYYGFDLFEDATSETDHEELNVKQHYSLSEVTNKLQQFQNDHIGFSYELVRGNTRQTLKNVDISFTKCDLAFIDGGHSIETIENDFQAVKNCPTILFDDYYRADNKGRCPDLENFGCNRLVEPMSPWVLPVGDPVVGGGLVHMAVTGALAKEFINSMIN